MAHLRLKSQHQQQPAIFSPSVARAAASAAKDWTFVEGWLRQKYNTRQPPHIERTPETLRALLALATANEAADEERDALARIDEAALAEIHKYQKHANQSQRGRGGATTTEQESEQQPDLETALLDALEASLSPTALDSLDALSETAVTLGCDAEDPQPSIIAARYADLQAESAALAADASRLALLTSYLARHSEQLSTLLSTIRDDGYHYSQETVEGEEDEDEGAENTPSPPNNDNDNNANNPYMTLLSPSLPQEIAQTTRQNTITSKTLPDLASRASDLEKLVSGLPSLTVDDVARDESSYQTRLSRKRELDGWVRQFAGLPPDVDAARRELESLREELRELTDLRDGDFERLVERESPVKTRKFRG